jgi:hypothetical protein
MRRQDYGFERVAGALAVFVGVGGLVYGILFAYIVTGAPDAVVTTWTTLAVLGGLAVTGVFAGTYERLRGTAGEAVARWAVLLGVAAGVGQMLNAAVALGYELNASAEGAIPDGPDPLGVLRFGLNGVALFLFGWAMGRDAGFPRVLAYVAEVAGVVLVVTYIGRLTGVIDPAERITLIPPLLYGLLLHPVLFVWVGVELWRRNLS